MSSLVVIKLGGSSLSNPSTLHEMTTLVHGLRHQGHRVVIVHGGGPAINEALTRKNIQWQFINGQRQTTPEMMAVIEDVLATKINSSLVENLRRANIPSQGLSGAEQQLLLCTQANKDLMQVGQIKKVNTQALEHILAQNNGPTPVIAPIGIGEQNEKYNIIADWAATEIAVALQAEKLIFLTDQNGILDQNKHRIQQINPEGIHKMIADGVISGGMYTKVMTMIAALNAGVQQVRVLNASQASQLIGGQNIGTLLTDDTCNATKEVPTWNCKTT